MSTEKLPRMLTVEEVQTALGGADQVSARTIQRWARENLIPGAVRVGRKLYFQRIPVTEWIEGGKSAQIFALEKRAG